MTVNLPSDVILQILSRLPSKSIARFRCVSKLWKSLLALDSPYFTELFLTQSITRPRLLFIVERKDNVCYLYSSSQISFKNSVSAELHMTVPNTWSFHRCTLVLGLLYCPTIVTHNSPMICNPTTRHRFSLPKLTRVERSFLGYNPISKQFSVLAFTSPLPSNQDLPSSCYQILNLESGRLSWRSLDCPLHHSTIVLNICINGILYYSAKFGKNDPWKIVCFDLNSEEFKFIDQPWPNSNLSQSLINFKGKLGGITIQWLNEEGVHLIKMSLWVLEDLEKEEWSKHVYVLPSMFCYNNLAHYRVVGVTGRGDVVLSLWYITIPFYVYFFNFEKKILRKVKIKGLEGFKDGWIQGCVDYVENLKAINWK